MIAIILAGGYAKRLWPLTLEKPKPLLPVAGRPVLDYILEWITTTSSQSITGIILLTNHKFEKQFQAWLGTSNYADQELDIVPDPSLSKEEKPGAIGALSAIVSRVDEDFLVIAGDCLYPGSLSNLMETFQAKNAPVVGVYHASNIEQVKRGSVVELDEDGVIMSYVEKPADPKGDLVGAVVYVFPARIKDRIYEYCGQGFSRDEPGHFIEWLCKVEKVYGQILEGVVWDIGTLDAYQEVNRILSTKARTKN